MNATMRACAGAAAVAMLVASGQLIPTPALAEPEPAPEPEMHNVTYIVQLDGYAPGTVATFMLNDNQTNSADLNVPAFQPFEAHATLADPAKAGMQLRLPFPAATTVHCQIEVDDIVAVKSARFIDTWWKDASNPNTGVMQCGAPLSGAA